MTSLSPATVGRLNQLGPARAAVRFSIRRAYAQTFASMVANRCTGVVSGILAARLLGPMGRGELAVIVFLPMLLISVGELELPRSLAYEASRNEVGSPELTSTGFWLALVLGCLQSMALVILLPYTLPSDKHHLISASRWFIPYLPAMYVTIALNGIDQGQGRFGRFSIFQALPGALYVLAVLAVWRTGAIRPQTFALAILAGALATAGFRVGIDWRAVLTSRPTLATSKKLLRRGIHFYLPALASLVLMRADVLLLVRLVPAAAIGLYAAAQAIAIGQIGTVNAFVQVGFAAVAAETEEKRAVEALARHFRLAQVAVALIGLVAGAFTPWAIRILFGAKFIQATATTYLLLISTALWGTAQVLDQGLRATSHVRAGIFSNLLGLVTLIALGVPASSRFGVNGIAAALAIAEAMNMGFLISFCAIRLNMRPRLLWGFDVATLRELRNGAYSWFRSPISIYVRAAKI